MTHASSEWFHMMKDLDNRFTYHKSDSEQMEAYKGLRSQARDLAQSICAQCPGGRERALALTKLEEVIFWANAGIARDQ